MTTAQTSLVTLTPEYCEHSKPNNESHVGTFICNITDFGFQNKCTLEEKKDCCFLEKESKKC